MESPVLCHSLPPLRAGPFGIGLDTYWPQFEGLEQRLTRPGIEVVDLGLIDNPVKALEAGQGFRSADIDLIFSYVTGYAL